MNWQTKIDHCFGLADRDFAEHPSDEATAFELLGILREKHVGWSTFERELRKRLAAMPKLDVDRQVGLVRPFFRPWLLD
jgi:hypothetical protein